MTDEMELRRLTEENDYLRKIIDMQQNTINRMVDYFVLEKKPKKDEE